MSQEKEIYFSKIIFIQHFRTNNTYIQLNLPQQEFSVQVYDYILDPRAIYSTHNNLHRQNK